MVENAGFQAVLTGEAESGTHRVLLAWEKLGSPPGVVVNVQGDEPLVKGDWIRLLTARSPSENEVFTLARPMGSEEALSPDRVKAVSDSTGRALYFSRSPIPHGASSFLKHIGVYCFSPESLKKCVSCGRSRLSSTEDLEQLAWLEAGLDIKIIQGDFFSIGVDTPEDLERAAEYFR
ncbi:MAG: 3-deoxy-manno-octulosonate cytidylyltransferase [Candidatus Aegiribacteria sp.]|nr:3-deoxy-manno-octulosonate cytidylyltransferase [Candidatus Aegiribacteria sp.]MBD3293971.1 3-deoxy-manno-octulosonate cytidylyltransferase [Candidatus Fermentibacteria bacterium]